MTYMLKYSDGTTALSTFGSIQSEDSTKTAQLMVNSMYGQDSFNTIIFDLGGAVRRIDIRGVITASSVSGAGGLASVVSELDALVNGRQDPTTKYPLIYYSDMILQTDNTTQKPIYVKLDTVQWHWIYGNVTAIEYTIGFVEARAGS